MDGGELFGVQDPNTQEVGFMYVMGQDQQHFGISRYPGTEGLRVLQSLESCDVNDPLIGSEILLNSSQLQVSWEDRQGLDRKDKLLIKNLGLKYRTGSWPLFRSYEPSLYPWFLTEAQGDLLLVALQQSLQVFQQLQSDPSLLDDLEDHHYLVRVSSPQGWRDEIRKVLPAVEKTEVISQIPSLAQLKALEGRKGCLEIDLILSPAVVRDQPEARPYFPYLLLLVDKDSGLILVSEFLRPFPSLDAMYGQVAEKVCASLLKIQLVPTEIRVRRKVLEGVLSPLITELDLRLTRQNHLAAVTEAVHGMKSFFKK